MKNSKIGWTMHTLNLWWGCVKISEGCLRCYACEIAKFRQHDVWGNDKPRRMINDVWENLEKFQKEAEALNEIHRVFVGSMMDIFEIPKPLVDKDGNAFTEGKDEFWNTGQLRDKFFNEIVAKCPNLMFLLLTKRPSNINKYIPEDWKNNPPANVMFGTSVSDQETANTFIPHLAKVNGKRFLSAEPLLGPIDLMQQDKDGNALFNSLNWIITGGESGGKDVRKMDSEWVSVIKNQCESNDIPFYFKQWGRKEFNPNQDDPTIKEDHPWHAKGGCLYDGNIHMNYPLHFNNTTITKMNLFEEDLFVSEQWQGFYTIYDLNSFLPAMNDETYSQLKRNIKLNGLDNQILYFEDEQKMKIIIDGHSRLRACRELGLTNIPSRKVNETFESLDEIKLWMVKNQCQRRNLSPVARLKLAFLSINEIERMAHKNLSDAGKNKAVVKTINTCEEIGKIAGVSTSTVSRYKFVIDHLKEFDEISRTIIDNLNNGLITISKAQSLMKKHSKKNAELPDFTPATITPETSPEISLETSSEISNQTVSEDIFENTSDYIVEDISDSGVLSHAIYDAKPNAIIELKSSIPLKIMEEVEITEDMFCDIDQANDLLQKGEIEAVIILKNKNQRELIDKYMKDDVKIVFMDFD